MKKILALALACLMLLSTSVFAATFSDMPADDHWATAALNNAVNNGLLTGSNGRVYPENNMTRAEMATIIARACGAEKDADISAFTDVTTDDWFYASMSKAVAMGAFNGSEGKLRPNNNITRQEAFVVLSRVFGLNVGEISVDVLDTFKDGSKVADWAKTSVAAIIQKGYVGGANGMLNPLDNITRAEFAVVMDRIIKYYIDDIDATTIPTDGNVMIRVGGLKLDGFETDKMVVIGDAVGESKMVVSNAKISDLLVVRGGSQVNVDGEFADIRIVMPNITLSGSPNDIKAIDICDGSLYSMGTILGPEFLSE